MNKDGVEDKEEIKIQLNLDIIRDTLSKNGYLFLRPIGKGGFSSVFLIFSNQYNLEFVVKVSSYKGSHKSKLPESYEFDLSEINNLINLNHRNIISMYKYFTDDHYLYVVLEYCEGGSLKDQIQQNGRIRSANLYPYCYQILKALKHCHDKKIAHNDIKPANVLIDKNQRLKLADFGLSKGFSPKLIYTDMSTMSGDEHSIGKNGEILIKHFAGSRPYMAPELLNYTAYDPFKADIWSLGVTFYELATGHLPWKTNDLEQMRLQISVGSFSFQNVKLNPSFCKIIHRMLEVVPSKRPTIDWLIEQPIFQQCENGRKNRASMVSKSISSGIIQSSFVSSSRLRTNDRIRNVFSFSSDSSPIIASDNENPASESMTPDKEQLIPTSPLQPDDELPFDNENHALRPEFDLKARPRSNARSNMKKIRASLPLKKTFL